MVLSKTNAVTSMCSLSEKTVLVLVIFEIHNIYLQQPMLNEVRERDREREGDVRQMKESERKEESRYICSVKIKSC